MQQLELLPQPEVTIQMDRTKVIGVIWDIAYEDLSFNELQGEIINHMTTTNLNFAIPQLGLMSNKDLVDYLFEDVSYGDFLDEEHHGEKLVAFELVDLVDKDKVLVRMEF